MTGAILRFVASGDRPWTTAAGGGPQPGRTPAIPGERVVVLDTAWTPARDDGAIGVRDVAAVALGSRDLYAETTRLLDAWAETSGIVDRLTVSGTSLWYQARLGHWWWLQERLLWLAIVDRLVGTERPSEIVAEPGAEPHLATAIRAVAARDRIATQVVPVDVDAAADPDPGSTLSAPETADAAATPAAGPAPIGSDRGPSLAARLLRRLRRGGRPEERVRRRAEMRRRLDPGRRGRPRVLVLSEHALQRVTDERGERWINPFLEPIADRLPDAGLDALIFEPRSTSADDATWTRVGGTGDRRRVTGDLLRTFDLPGEAASAEASAAEIVAGIRAIATPLVVDGIDLGPDLVARVAAAANETLGRRLQNVVRQRRLLAAARPAALMLADEYQRQEWLAAARLEGIPTVAIQHGGIQRWHMGYIHATRPTSLTLPDRTVLFGDWERRLLTTASVYRESELSVGGSARLDLVGRREAADRASVRAELGVAEGDRVVVVSTTWGHLLRRFHFAIAIARLVEAPLPRVHLVVKLHPSEPDDGLYRRLIEGVAAAGGTPMPPMTVVKSIDLYRLLASADAHVGLYSTVLTEAVVTGTPNFIVAGIEPFDLLGYVEAGVAVPIRDGRELLAALDAGRGEASAEARQAFLADHFRPGAAGPRIAADLAAWLSTRGAAPDDERGAAVVPRG